MVGSAKSQPEPYLPAPALASLQDPAAFRSRRRHIRECKVEPRLPWLDSLPDANSSSHSCASGQCTEMRGREQENDANEQLLQVRWLPAPRCRVRLIPHWAPKTHVIGFATVALLDADAEPSVVAANKIFLGRLIASCAAAALLLAAQLTTKSSHPPAAATLLLITLGAFNVSLASATALIVGVLTIACLGEALRLLRA